MPASKDNLTDASYRFDGFKVLAYSYEDNGLRPNLSELDFNYRFQFMVSENLATVIIRMHTSIIHESNSETPIIKLSTQSLFSVKGLTLIEDDLEIPNHFMATLLNLTIGTTRGILIAKNFGTPYEKVILPVIPLQEILPKGTLPKIDKMIIEVEE